MHIEIIYQTKNVNGLVRDDGDIFVDGDQAPSFTGYHFFSRESARHAGRREAHKVLLEQGIANLETAQITERNGSMR